MHRALVLVMSAIVGVVSEVLLRRLAATCAVCEEQAGLADKSSVDAISGLIVQTIDEVPGIPAIVKMLLKNPTLVVGIAQMVNDSAEQTLKRALEVVDEAKKAA